MEKYINATRILDSIDAALKITPPRANGKSERFLTNYVTLGVVKNMIQDEIQHREFRPVVHAHWVGTDGSYKCSKCGSVCIEKADEWIDIQFGCDPVLFCPRCGAVMDEPTENYGYFPVPEDYE